MTARLTGRAGAKAGLSDPAVKSGIAVAQRIKGTPGITGSSFPRVHIDGRVWHLDVGSSHPGAEAGPKGWAVRPLKRHASWVQNVELDCVSCGQLQDENWLISVKPSLRYRTRSGQYRGKTTNVHDTTRSGRCISGPTLLETEAPGRAMRRGFPERQGSAGPRND